MRHFNKNSGKCLLFLTINSDYAIVVAKYTKPSSTTAKLLNAIINTFFLMLVVILLISKLIELRQHTIKQRAKMLTMLINIEIM